MKGFPITRGSNLFRIKSSTFWLKDFVNTNLKFILEENFEPMACNVNPLLRNLGYNNNSTQNQNVFQTTATNLLGISSAKITFSNESITPIKKELNPTIQSCSKFLQLAGPLTTTILEKQNQFCKII